MSTIMYNSLAKIEGYLNEMEGIKVVSREYVEGWDYFVLNTVTESSVFTGVSAYVYDKLKNSGCVREVFRLSTERFSFSKFSVIFVALRTGHKGIIIIADNVLALNSEWMFRLGMYFILQGSRSDETSNVLAGCVLAKYSKADGVAMSKVFDRYQKKDGISAVLGDLRIHWKEIADEYKHFFLFGDYSDYLENLSTVLYAAAFSNVCPEPKVVEDITDNTITVVLSSGNDKDFLKWALENAPEPVIEEVIELLRKHLGSAYGNDKVSGSYGRKENVNNG